MWNSYYSYDAHERFGYFQAPDITSRLYLALIFCASSTLLPNKRYNATGAEVALDLVRKSWKNTPLSDEQSALVEMIQKHAWHFPALSLLCDDLLSSSNQMRFLDKKTVVGRFSDAATEYINSKLSMNFRSSLSPEEEIRFLSYNISTDLLERPTLPRHGRIEVNPHDTEGNLLLISAEKILRSLYTYLVNNSLISEFPITRSKLSPSNVIGNVVIDDLENSWNAFHSLTSVRLIDSMEHSHGVLSAILNDVSKSLQSLEEYLLKVIDDICVPSWDDWHMTRHRLGKLANIFPMVHKTDLMRIGVDISLLHTLNPFLTGKSETIIISGIVYWLELCAMEDRVKRLLSYVIANNIPQFTAELQFVREWPVEEHLEWLVFEVEGQLQIRPQQYEFVRRLIDNPGSIGQLNMGEGKTRVILPMIVLHLAKGEDIVRLHFLTQLLDEGFNYLHRYLCASVLNRKIFRLPFNRDYCLNLDDIAVLESILDYCRQCRGCLCVAPEHRLSLYLKSDELALLANEESDLLAEKLRAIENSNSFVDVFDEADEILRHKYELVYAVGISNYLPGGVARWNAVQCLLRVISDSSNPRLGDILNDEKITVRNSEYRIHGVSFNSVRFLSGTNLVKEPEEFLRLLMNELFNNTPYEYFWLSRVTHLRNEIIDFTTDSKSLNDKAICDFLNEKVKASTMSPSLEEWSVADSPEMQSLLALRGLLGFGILLHCLQNRHRIDYGIKRPAKKRLAVPFQAADTPSPRSEFQHPDIAIVYTTLSYYDDGLSKDELLEAFRHLLDLGPDAQADVYNEWYKRSRSVMSHECAKSLDDVCKIDLSNVVQNDLLVKYYSRNMETINYWLAFVVLPVETKQYSQRMMANGWHLCANSKRAPIGFSGTSDNKMLLPLQVKQTEMSERTDIMGTDGKMLYLLLKCSDYVSVDEMDFVTNDHVPNILANIISQLKVNNANALIDAGGLIVGRSNRDTAFTLAATFTTVVYFNTDFNEWYVLDNIGREWSLCNSPIREKDAFVFFDDRRCRGSDMKLKPDARAMVTIGPKMSKDKLMQAAGRMRQLDKGQSIFLAGCRDVTFKIRTLMGSSTITTRDAMHWVLNNTIDSIVEGLMMWTIQGAHFCHTHQQHIGAVCMNEVLTLEEFYYRRMEFLSLADVACDSITGYRKQLPDTKEMSPELKRYCDRIAMLLKGKGKDFQIMRTGLDEECERELEIEVLVEREIKIEVAQVDPAHEKDWDFKGLLEGSYCSASRVPTSKSLQVVVCESLEETLSSIRWSEGVFCTANFINTVMYVEGDEVGEKEDFLRLVHFIVLFPSDQSMLLVSEREADIILSSIPRAQSPLQFELVNLAYCKLAVSDPEGYRQLGPALPQQLPTLLLKNIENLVSVQMFAGDTKFTTNEQLNALRRMLSFHAYAREAVLKLPTYRGLQHCLPRSDLEKVVQCLME
mmetsp:Transcript_33769/g.49019  ORF Transcript_33769/g.49019 Transcript_33769/m.49019 type:complete len:1441 (+) Transcript_33769:465-4787(+)